MDHINEYQLYFSCNGQKKILDTYSRETIDKTISELNLSEYVLFQHGKKIADTRVNPFKKELEDLSV